MTWVVYAVLAAVFASLTAILAKVGLTGIDSHLATAIRTAVVLALAWGMVFITGAQKDITVLTQRNLVFLTLSGLATGFSWLCYYKALQLGPVSKVAPIDKLSVVLTIILAAVFLHEPVTLKTGIGAAFLVLGIMIML